MADTFNLSNAVKRLKAINFALENLEVKGRSNLDILLGSMQAIDKVVSEIECGIEIMGVQNDEPDIQLEVESPE